MTEDRDIIAHTEGTLQGPHLELPPGFVPLMLSFEPRKISVEIMRPSVLVGRHSRADLRLTADDVSRHHCRFIFANNEWRVYDLKSLNGVFVNQKRVEEATLHAGDIVYLGSVRVLIDSATPTAVAPIGADESCRAS